MTEGSGFETGPRSQAVVFQSSPDHRDWLARIEWFPGNRTPSRGQMKPESALPRPQQIVNPGRQLIGREWLLDETGAGLAGADGAFGRVVVAGHEQHFDPRPEASQLAGQFPAAHMRH